MRMSARKLPMPGTAASRAVLDRYGGSYKPQAVPWIAAPWGASSLRSPLNGAGWWPPSCIMP